MSSQVEGAVAQVPDDGGRLDHAQKRNGDVFRGQVPAHLPAVLPLDDDARHVSDNVPDDSQKLPPLVRHAGQDLFREDDPGDRAVAADQLKVPGQENLQFVDGLRIQRRHILEIRIQARLNQSQNGVDDFALVFIMPVDGGRHDIHPPGHGGQIEGAHPAVADDLQRGQGDLVVAYLCFEPFFGHFCSNVNTYSPNEDAGVCQAKKCAGALWTGPDGGGPGSSRLALLPSERGGFPFRGLKERGALLFGVNLVKKPDGAGPEKQAGQSCAHIGCPRNRQEKGPDND